MRTLGFAAIGLVLSALAGAQTSTLETQNEQVVRRYIEAINRHDAKAAAAGFAEDVKNFGRPLGRKGMEDVMADIFNTFPDWHMEIENIIASGDQVVVRCRVTGTHQGIGKMPLNGMPVGAAGLTPEDL
jgi:predicted ester cyclase